MNRIIKSLLILTVLIVASCAPKQSMIPIGAIPRPGDVTPQDEQYGHSVLGKLTQQYPLSQNDSYIRRSRKIVSKIVDAIYKNAPRSAKLRNPWHVHVLNSPKTLNAGATRGNYIFVWSGLLDFLKDDGELAAVLSHEVAHVLAGHTERNPAEEANKMIAGIAGAVARAIIGAQATNAGQFGGQAAQAVVSQTLKGFLVNPDSQRQELEADQIGIFLLADAGYNPEDAVRFWRRVQNDSRFGGNSFQFFSTHPTSKTRLARLVELLPYAKGERINNNFVDATNSPSPKLRSRDSGNLSSAGDSKGRKSISGNTIITETERFRYRREGGYWDSKRDRRNPRDYRNSRDYDRGYRQRKTRYDDGGYLPRDPYYRDRSYDPRSGRGAGIGNNKPNSKPSSLNIQKGRGTFDSNRGSKYTPESSRAISKNSRILNQRADTSKEENALGLELSSISRGEI